MLEIVRCKWCEKETISRCLSVYCIAVGLGEAVLLINKVAHMISGLFVTPQVHKQKS